MGQFGTPARPAIRILWASSTGNAEGVAALCAGQLTAGGHAVTLCELGDVKVTELASAPRVLFVVSTFGDGDPPDNAAVFWADLLASKVLRLAAMAFSVLALGDSNYDRFCGFGRRLDARLEALGATRLLTRHDCDVEYQQGAKTWLDSILKTLARSPVPVGAAMAAVPVAAGPTAGEEDLAAPLPAYGRSRPLRTRLVLNKLLNAPGAHKETRQLAFDLAGHDFSYEAGDALGIWPTNVPGLVTDMLTALKLPPATAVAVKDRGDATLAEALSRHVEIARITPEILRFVSERSGHRTLAELLKEEHKDELQQWLWGRQIIDLLQAFPIEASTSEWLTVLKPLQPRLYSISSSPKTTPEQVQLTVSVLRYGANLQRGDVCSTFLADRDESAVVPIFVQKSAHFRPPANPETPMIMVGPGTGIAPFRAFLHERRATGAQGRNWLVFGEQRAATDFYYRQELEALRHDGYLHRLDTAFSRDQTEKIYVQHRLRQHGAELWRWLQEGAHFYVCGDAGRMAKDVDAALRQVAQAHGTMSAQDAAAYIAKLTQEKRYVRDVY